jgi:uncharacterized membrane protein YoaK (UPF0700 family)
LGVPGVSTTYITSTLTTLSAELVGWTRPGRAQRIRLLAAVVITYGLGALVGGVLQSRASTLVIWLPLISVVAVVVNARFRYRHEPFEPAPRGDARSASLAASRRP